MLLAARCAIAMRWGAGSKPQPERAAGESGRQAGPAESKPLDRLGAA
jgi:hypothetical protein